VELNLMPESTLKWQSFNQKKPYFIASVFSLVAVVAAIGWLFSQLADAKVNASSELEQQITPMEQRSQQFGTAYKALQKTQKDVGQVVGWMDNRYYWADVLSNLRDALIRVESGVKTKMRADAGVWIERFVTVEPSGMVGMEGGIPAPPGMAAAPGMAPPPPPPANPEGAPPGAPGATPAGGAAPGGIAKSGANEISTIEATFRAVDMSLVSPSANPDIAYQVLNEIKNIQGGTLCDAELSPNITPVEPPGTFTFVVTIKLKHPLKL
jgi:hypothetical protein